MTPETGSGEVRWNSTISAIPWVVGGRLLSPHMTSHTMAHDSIRNGYT